MRQKEKSSGAFAGDQFQEAYPNGVQNHYWNLGRNLVIANTLKKLKDVGRTMEIGAGRGIVIDYLRRQGVDAWGCELAKVEVISSSIKEFFFSGQDAFQLKEPFRNEFRTLLLLDVLEHMENPEAFLLECERKFPNLKYLLVTVPARQELWSNYDEKYGHFRRYGWRSASELGNELAGTWKLLRQFYFFRLLYPPARVLSLLGIKRNTIITPPLSKAQILLHKCLAFLFSLEAILLPKRLAGTSLLKVSEKV